MRSEEHIKTFVQKQDPQNRFGEKSVLAGKAERGVRRSQGFYEKKKKKNCVFI